MELHEKIIAVLASTLFVLGMAMFIPIIAVSIKWKIEDKIQEYKNKKEKKHNEEQRDS